MCNTDYKTGEKCGQWTILEKFKRDRKHWAFKCQCSCGAVRIVYHPRSGLERCQICKTRDHNRDIDLVGRVFGAWLVLSPVVVPGKRKKWLCRCNCGREASVLTTSLLRGNSTKCRKCVHHQMQMNGKMSFQKFFLARRGAESRGIYFDPSVTREYLERLFEEQNGKCAISGVDIKFADTIKSVKRGGDTASIDRIDPDGPYEIGNIHWVHKVVNIMKGRMTTDELVQWCRQIVCNRDGVVNPTPPSFEQDGWMFGTKPKLQCLRAAANSEC